MPAPAVEQVQQAFADLLQITGSHMLAPSVFLSESSKDCEAKMWDAFAEVYEQELQQLQQEKEQLPKERKRQILADILVWAEITQSDYDQETAAFVTEPHGNDASFQRIGNLLKAAKKKRGL